MFLNSSCLDLHNGLLMGCVAHVCVCVGGWEVHVVVLDAVDIYGSFVC